MLKRLNSLLGLFGIEPGKFLRSAHAIPWFLRSLKKARTLNSYSNAEFPFGKLYPCLTDRNDFSGMAKGHYFHQDLLVARKIFANNPVLHLDIGSRVDGFVAHVACYRDIEVLDVREQVSTTPGIIFRQADLMQPLSPDQHQICDSLSCLHALEHFGLGRYGDELDMDGHKTGFLNMSMLLKPGGKFYLSVPVGPQRIEFNAHRVFSIQYLLDMVNENFTIASFAFVDDEGNLHENASLTEAAIRNNFDCHFGCGILELVKK